MILQRKIYKDLLKWKSNNGASALLIEGARRVGKSFIVEEFAKNEYKSYILIDFSMFSDEQQSLFKQHQQNLDLFFNMLQIMHSTTLYERESLIIFDEVQLFPLARQMIKHLVKDGRYDYIETGSLLSLKTNIDQILLPSEEEKITMHPFDFEEFLLATGDEVTYQKLREFYESKTPLGQVAHRKIKTQFREYMLVGGMPQAIVEYVKTKDFGKVELVKRRILELYRNDVPRFAKGYETSVLNVFDNIPSELNKENKRFQFSSVGKAARYRTHEKAFAWLNEAKVVNVSFNVTDPSLALKLSKEQNMLKLYMADTGLLVTQAMQNKTYLESDIYKALLFDKLGINEGMFVENIIGQLLVANGYELFFHANTGKNNSDSRMQIDFLITKEQKVIPIEVKSSDYNKHSSLDKFKTKFGKRVGTKVVLHTKDLKVTQDTLYLPLYMVCFL